jgi:hypothetical protein
MAQKSGRHPRFQGLRDDKELRDVSRELPA